MANPNVPFDLMLDTAWSDAVSTSEDMNYETCSLQQLTDTMNNRGNKSNSYGSLIQGIPCRIDVDVKALIPDRVKDDVEVQKLIRYLFISASWIITNNIMPKVGDYIFSNSGQPLGDTVQYRVIEVNTETDQLDLCFLLEIVY